MCFVFWHFTVTNVRYVYYKVVILMFLCLKYFDCHLRSAFLFLSDISLQCMYFKVFSVFRGFPGVSAGKESVPSVGDQGSIFGLGISPGEGNGCPLQYSGLENSMDCIVQGISKGLTRWSDFPFSLTHSVFLNLKVT